MAIALVGVSFVDDYDNQKAPKIHEFEHQIIHVRSCIELQKI